MLNGINVAAPVDLKATKDSMLSASGQQAAQVKKKSLSSLVPNPADKSKEPKKEFSDVLEKNLNEPKRPQEKKLQNSVTSKIEKKALVQNLREREPQSQEISPKENIGEPSQKDGVQQRSEVMLEFMDSFESEFGISPARLAEAMVKIESDKLGLPPEVTAQDVISQLQLDPEDESRAQQMYLQMLMQTQNPTEVYQLVEKSGGALGPQAAAVAAMGLGQIKNQTADPSLKQVAQSPMAQVQSAQWQKQMPIEKINIDESSFANSTLVDPSIENALIDDLATQDYSVGQMTGNPELDQLLGELDIKMSQLGHSLKNIQTEVSVKPKSLMQESDLLLNSDYSQEALGAAVGSELVQTMGPQDPQLQSLKGDDLNAAVMQKGLQSSDFKVQNFSQNQNPNMGQEQNNSSSGSSKEKKDEVELSSKKTVPTRDDFLLKHPKGDELVQGSQSQGAKSTALAGATAQALPRDSEANIEKIMKQADYMIKKGGGEVKVKLTPEGLGDVMLKVVMKEGKVNLQMATDSQEAKKILESGLGDLKKSLASQSISLDNVRIEVAPSSEASGHMKQNMNFQGEAGREQARQFLQDFRDFNQNQRQMMFDGSNYRQGTREPKEAQKLEPVTASSKKYAGYGSKGSGLNLVA